MAENVFMEASDPNQSFMESVGNSIKDVGAGIGNFLNPLAEATIDIPGIQTPWEDKAGKWLRENNTQYRGENISGAKILEDRFGVENNVGKYGGGFAIDILTDPLTYVGLGASQLAKFKSASKSLEGLAAGTTSKGVESAQEAIKSGAQAAEKSFTGFRREYGATTGGRTLTQQAPKIKLPGLGEPGLARVPGIHTPAAPYETGASQILAQSLARRIETAQPISRQVAGPYIRDYEKAIKVPKESFNSPKDVAFAGPNNPTRANIASSEGKAVAEDLPIGPARDLSREEQANLFTQMSDRLGDMNEAEKTFALRHFEDELVSRGFSFSDGRLSDFRNTKGLAKTMGIPHADPHNLEHFTTGVTRKVAHEDFVTAPEAYKKIIAQKLEQGEGKVIGKYGINPLVVEDARLAATSGRTPIAVKAPIAARGEAGRVALEEAESFAGNLGKRVPGTKITRHKELNPANQANLYNRMFDATKKLPEIKSSFKGMHGSEEALKWRRATALSMLRRAEDHLISTRGLRGQHWNGSGLRLSEVIAEVGDDVLEDYIPRVLHAFETGNVKDLAKLDPEVRHIIERAIGRRVAVTGGVAKTIYDDMAKRATAAQEFYSPQKYGEWLRGEDVLSKQRAMNAGLTNKEAEAVSDLVKNHTTIQDVQNLEPFQVIEALGPKLAKQMLEVGKVDAKMQRQETKAITKQLGKRPGQISRDVLQNEVKDWMWHNLTTWRGRGAMMPSKRTLASMGQLWAKARADWFGQIMKDYTKEEIQLAFAFSQKPLSHVADITAEINPRVAELAGKFSDYFDNMLATPYKVKIGGKYETRSLKDLKDIEGSFAVRSQATMHDFNRSLQALGSDFRFKADKNGNWMDSWKHADPKTLKQNPGVFMYTLDQAIQQTAAEYNLVDMFATEFGKIPGETGFVLGEHTHPVHHHRIPSDAKFDQQVSREFTKLLQDMEKGAWRPGSKPTHYMTQATRRWKSAVTIYYPSHHIRNLIGDTWLMWTAGHNDPRVFGKAMKVIGSERKRYADAIADPDISKMNKLLDPNADNWVNTEAQAIISRKHGANIRADEFYAEALQRGLLVDASKIEDLQGNTLKVFREGDEGPLGSLRNPKPLGGKAHNVASTAAEVREHYVRLAHFISFAEKHMTREMGAKLQKATSPVERSEIMASMFDKAALEIRKYHPDGTDMSFFEQKYLRNIIPFYAWQRKAVPLTIEAFVQRPAKVMAYPRAMAAIQGSLGIETGGVSDPFPTDQLFPDWVLGQGVGPIGDPESDNPIAKFFGQLGRNQISPFGTEKGYTQVNPGGTALPTGIIGQMLGMGDIDSLKHGAMSQLSPLISIPTEVLSGRTELDQKIGGPEGDVTWSEYGMGKIPQTEILQRTLGINKEVKPWQEGYDTGKTEPLLNLFTALGIQGTGKWTKSAQFDLQNRLKAAGGG